MKLPLGGQGDRSMSVYPMNFNLQQEGGNQSNRYMTEDE
ncbi:hypothetical protein RINTU1_26670 [Candidatus Regiella insecticola]|uniref:Uncharacterized protein n=1 Tax=Candidatus Regiella insecticola TaxID=138073 RepID=A0A6L2ZRQ5_9ENTR|nr:hypothetical protein RINTU1_26670 [Candidatus Regiella insecticola]